MKKLKVVVVDDSAFSRRTITRMLEGMPAVDVVGYAIDGEEGIQKVIALKPDLVTLDLEMPKMDGFTLLRILTIRFSLPVIVISALSGADKIFRALELGALDFIPKPSSNASFDLLSIKEDLQKKVLQVMSLPSLRKIPVNREFPGYSVLSAVKPTGDPGAKPLRSSFTAFDARPASSGSHQFDLVAIGSSTGGPPALKQIFSTFEKKYPFAVVVSQHMPPGFTKAFADRLNQTSPFDIKEAEDGDHVLSGTILIAPGGKNMEIGRAHV